MNVKLSVQDNNQSSSRISSRSNGH